jgi:hypothetical protein
MAICIQSSFGAPAKPVTAKDFEAVLDNPSVAESYRLCRTNYSVNKKVYDEEKKKLPAWIFSCSSFLPHEWIDSKGKNHGTDTWRHQEYGVLNGLFMVDLDHLDDPLATWKMLLADDRFTSYYQPRMFFAFMTPSGHGLKIVMKCDLQDGNLASAQNRFCRELGLKNDNETKDSSRLSFVCPRSEVLYYDSAMHTYENASWIKKYQPVYCKALSEPDLFADDGKQTPQADETTPQETISHESFDDYRYEGLEIPVIIDKWLEQFDTSVGKRHAVLLQLTSELKYVCERNEAIVKYFVNKLRWVEDLRKEGDSVDQTIEDGLSYKMGKQMPDSMTIALKSLGVNPSIKKDPSVVEAENALMPKFIEYGKEIEELTPYFPCLKEVCYQMRTSSKPACMFTGAALFGTLMTRMYYYFYHRPEEQRRLNYGVFIVDDPATGKSFASDLYKIILSPIIAADKVGNDLLNKFKLESQKRDTSTKEQKKDALTPPQVKIRIHGARTSNQTFIEDMNACVENDGDGKPVNLHLFTFDSELENNARITSGGQWIDKSVFELKAFHNEEDNQQYKNKNSVSGPFNVYWNFVYTGTPISLNKKVNLRTFGSGLYSRLAVLPLCADSFDMIPLYMRNKENVEVINRLKEWAFKLDTVGGELPIWPLVEYTYHWMENIMMLAKEDQDKVTAMLVKRVPYYGLHIAVPYIFMRHYEEWMENDTFKVDDTDKRLVDLCLEIQLCTQRYFFGGMASAYYQNKLSEEQANKVNYYSKSDRLLEALPSSFTEEDLIRVGEMSINYARVQLWRWQQDHKVVKTGKGKKAKYTK